MNRSVLVCLCVMSLVLTSCTSGGGGARMSAWGQNAPPAPAYMRYQTGIGAHEVSREEPVDLPYWFTDVNGELVSGVVAGHLIVGGRCYSLTTNTFWDFEREGQRLMRATPGDAELAGHWIEFGTLSVGQCPYAVHVASYHDPQRIYGVVLYNPRRYITCNFEQPFYHRLEHVGADGRVTLFNNDVEFGGRALVGLDGLAPIRDGQRGWVSPAEAIGEYVRVTDEQQSCVLTGAQMARSALRDALFSGRVLRSRVNKSPLGDQAWEVRPRTRSGPEPWPGSPITADNLEGQLMFGRVLQTGAAPGPWKMCLDE